MEGVRNCMVLRTSAELPEVGMTSLEAQGVHLGRGCLTLLEKAGGLSEGGGSPRRGRALTWGR